VTGPTGQVPTSRQAATGWTPRIELVVKTSLAALS
jgi:hypothetical protein